MSLIVLPAYCNTPLTDFQVLSSSFFSVPSRLAVLPAPHILIGRVLGRLVVVGVDPATIEKIVGDEKTHRCLLLGKPATLMPTLAFALMVPQALPCPLK